VRLIAAAAGAGVVLFVATLMSGCGVLVTKEAPPDLIEISAPPLLEVDPYVDAAVPAPVRALSPARARRVARRAALEILVPACDDDARGRGFAGDAHPVVAQRDVIEGSGRVRVFGASRRSTAVGPGSAYRLDDLGVVQVARTLPGRLRPTSSVGAGASVVAVTERNGKLRMLPGVVVDAVPGAPYDVPTKLLRVTSAVRDGDVGPVLDAKGRVVAVVFAVDPGTTFGLALPVSSLRGRAVGRVAEALDACD
jgi:hypothetical protein